MWELTLDGPQTVLCKGGYSQSQFYQSLQKAISKHWGTVPECRETAEVQTIDLMIGCVV